MLVYNRPNTILSRVFIKQQCSVATDTTSIKVMTKESANFDKKTLMMITVKTNLELIMETQHSNNNNKDVLVCA